jgi:hypothetical protein
MLLSIGKNPEEMMSRKEKVQFKNLPAHLTVFRGTSTNSIVTPKNIKKLFGNSWSLDKEISIWFAMKHSPRYRGSRFIVLLTYEIDRNEVISYFTDRNENEVFLDYEKINLKNVKFEIIPKEYEVKDVFKKSSPKKRNSQKIT